MTDNQVLAICTSIIRLCGGPSVNDAAREAVEIGRVFGIEPSEHTEKELGIVNPFSGDDLAVLPGRKAKPNAPIVEPFPDEINQVIDKVWATVPGAIL